MERSGDTSFIKYLTYNNNDARWQLYCTTLGRRTIPPGVVYPPGKKIHPPEYRSVGSTGRILHEYQVVYITHGRGTLKMEQGEYSITPGALFIVFPGVWHWYSSDITTGWDEYWVGFTGEYGRALRENGILNPENPVLDIGVNSTIVHQFREMFKIAMREPPGFQPKLAGSLIQLLAYAYSFAQQKSHGNETEQQIQKARSIMEDHVFNKLEMDELSAMIGTSYTHFRSLFKNYTGESPYQYYLHIKINKAKELLESGSYPVKEVAFELGFTNQYYFSRLFKKKTGVCPSCWHEACS